MDEKTCDQVVVMGSSMAGLLAARVLSERFERVVVIERDPLPPIGEHRRGVPHGRHLHGLHPRGREILDELFPGFTEALTTDGAVGCDVLGDLRWQLSGHQLIARRAVPDARSYFRAIAAAIDVPAEGRLLDTRVMEHLAARLAAIPGVVAVTLGGSRATGTAVKGSDWDFGLYYRGGLDPADITALGWPGRVFAPGEWGSIVNGGAWLTVDGARVDLIYRDLDEVLRWTEAAGDGRFEIRREVGYVAGIATYILAGELALGRVLAGDLPRPAFPPRLLQTAPDAWFRLAAGALSFAGVYAGRQDRVACLANLCQAVLATGQGRMAAAGQWVLNEKRLTERAGLDAIQDRLAQPGPDLDALVSDVRARLGLDDPVWAVRPAD